MSAKQLLCCCCLILTFTLTGLAQSENASVSWSGYLNDKSLTGEVYGYLSVSDDKASGSKLRLLCHGRAFTLLLDDELAANAGTVAIAVDSLSEMFFTIEPVDAGQGISNQTDAFWDLIARMVAGATIRIDTGVGGDQQYTLTGFTQAYQDGCGWSGLAGEYTAYLHYYQ
jgi:hypothetical protein